jgi:hypothetical protein
MRKFANCLALFAAPFLCGCGPPAVTDDTADDSNASTLETDCESFCGRAVGCSEEFAADWDFEFSHECTDYCVSFTHSKVALYDAPACEQTIRAMWECAGMLESCDDFDLFENAAFNMSAIGGKPCADELIEFLDHCN